jgi:hypothetical protein
MLLPWARLAKGLAVLSALLGFTGMDTSELTPNDLASLKEYTGSDSYAKAVDKVLTGHVYMKAYYIIARQDIAPYATFRRCSADEFEDSADRYLKVFYPLPRAFFSTVSWFGNPNLATALIQPGTFYMALICSLAHSFAMYIAQRSLRKHSEHLRLCLGSA